MKESILDKDIAKMKLVKELVSLVFIWGNIFWYGVATYYFYKAWNTTEITIQTNYVTWACFCILVEISSMITSIYFRTEKNVKEQK